MEITLRKVTDKNYQAISDLSVDQSQNLWVAPNSKTLLQAAYEPELNVMAIYQEENPVGLLLYDYDTDMGGWTLSRFMIDKHHQHKGIGRIALNKFLIFFHNEYPIEKLYTSAETDNLPAQTLYEQFGFEKKEEFSYINDGINFCEVKMVKEHF
ncbi:MULTISPECIES: N-acetyltransferase [Lactococcus]|uniref:GNAT family N-acetyltransferase n=1 Tax=Lactococcus TaxID=1357 RepID=UPI00071DAE47|nr:MULTISPECIES: GNAT family N-acetyltransferase [Lactococcus]KAF6609432.1 GNAT family N-acetyltransferase [Lactococcus sp. EKM201L]KAF6612362.1 GNAT family N-acetyltransferase [Lactococcus sp. EKM203L]KAF6641627.1 GNAT family N-acetyltransferase [Lactococcus sp. EKM501L]KAF6644650.1 GNAT family N-acetyltransferase [Lactococcus sp. EKM502L]KAF6652158.1 GNAT family N-acetyltransferase [Lactococcus sp. EKM101L]